MNPWQISHVLAFAPFLLYACVSLADTEYPVAEASAILAYARIKAPSNPPLQAELARISDSYEIVFIPGMGGSRLIQDGREIYGKGSVDPKLIALRDPNRPAKAEVLGQYGYFADWNVYEGGLAALERVVGKPVREFAYDWRMDIEWTAAEFESTVGKELKDKKVIIVAHSMGGLVAWHWKNKYRAKRPPFALVLLGVPLRGTCEAARILVDGFSSRRDGLAAHVLGPAHPALFTFPSVFQLLPRWNGANCLRFDESTGAMNLFDWNTWNGRNYGVLKTFANKTRMNDEEYERAMRFALERASNFQKNFTTDQRRNERTYYGVSTPEKMPERYIVTVHKQWLAIRDDAIPGGSNGDGRVLRPSALNDDPDPKKGRHPTNGIFVGLDRAHDELLDDKRFRSFVDSQLVTDIRRDMAAAIAPTLLAQPSIVAELSALKMMLRVGLVRDDAQDTERDTYQKVAAYNASQLQGAGESPLAAVDRSIKLKLRFPYHSFAVSENSPFIVTLLETKLALAPEKVSPSELALLASGQTRRADRVWLTQRAADLAEAPGLHSAADKAFVFERLAEAYRDNSNAVWAQEAAIKAMTYRSSPESRSPDTPGRALESGATTERGRADTLPSTTLPPPQVKDPFDRSPRTR